jgi:hypothetical protein
VRVDHRKVNRRIREAQERSTAEARGEAEEVKTSKGKTTKEGASTETH